MSPRKQKETRAQRLLVVPMAWERWRLLGGVWAARRHFEAGVKTWQWNNWLVVSPGIGEEVSRVVAERLSELPFHEIWLVGICGGLNPLLRAGDLVKVTEQFVSGAEPADDTGAVREQNLRELVALEPLDLSRTGFRGRIFEGPGICSTSILSRAEKLDLANKGSGAIVEMESSVWRVWAEAKRIPFVHLRVVSDPVDREPLAWKHLRPAHWTADLTRRKPTSESNQSPKSSNRFGNSLTGSVRDWWQAAKTLRQLGNCLRRE
jgi:nucleoside phosphorylase